MKAYRIESDTAPPPGQPYRDAVSKVIGTILNGAPISLAVEDRPGAPLLSLGVAFAQTPPLREAFIDATLALMSAMSVPDLDRDTWLLLMTTTATHLVIEAAPGLVDLPNNRMVPTITSWPSVHKALAIHDSPLLNVDWAREKIADAQRSLQKDTKRWPMRPSH